MNLGPASWVPRAHPLAPVAAVGTGAAAETLGRLLLEREGSWRVAAGPGLLLVEGAELPWVHGLFWLGRDPRAPGLLLPTHLEPPVHPALIASRLGPVALTLDPPRQLALSALGALHRPALEAWLDAP